MPGGANHRLSGGMNPGSMPWALRNGTSGAKATTRPSQFKSIPGTIPAIPRNSGDTIEWYLLKRKYVYFLVLRLSTPVVVLSRICCESSRIFWVVSSSFRRLVMAR